MKHESPIRILAEDVAPADGARARARRKADPVLDGLRAARKHLPCSLLYDARGAALFERICTIDAYYPTRTEIALLGAHVAEVAADVGPGARVIEPGSGEGVKTRMLLEALDRPAAYVPIDVSEEQLRSTAATLRAAFPGMEVAPLAGDYTTRLTLPQVRAAYARTLVFFPGSTIGNFEPDDAREFLARFGDLAGPGAKLLLGADGTSDVDVLLRAYDDEEGVTAEFNLNLLAHVNRLYSATFDLDAFAHRAVWNAARSRIEMHLVSRVRQSVRVGGDVGGEWIHFARGESIVTEHCYKHSAESIRELLAAAGWRVRTVYPGAPQPLRLWACERG
jgi:dimethylhistidine N-methyltransferase